MSFPRKLTISQNIKIRAAYSGGTGVAQLAREFQVSTTTIHRVLRGQHTAAPGLDKISRNPGPVPVPRRPHACPRPGCEHAYQTAADLVDHLHHDHGEAHR